MMKKTVAATLAAVVVSLAVAAGVARADWDSSPTFSYWWKHIALSEDACVSVGRTALINAGYTIHDVNATDVWGWHGDFIATVVCGAVPSASIVYIVVAAPGSVPTSQTRADAQQIGSVF